MTINQLRKNTTGLTDHLRKHKHLLIDPDIVDNFSRFERNIVEHLNKCALFRLNAEDLAEFLPATMDYMAILSELKELKLPYPEIVLDICNDRESTMALLVTTFDRFRAQYLSDGYATNNPVLATSDDLGDALVCLEAKPYGDKYAGTNNGILFPGNFVLINPNGTASALGSLTKFGQLSADTTQYTFGGDLLIVHTFLKLLTCKNIYTRTRSADPRKKKNNRKPRPDLEYQEIVIKVPGKKITYNGEPVTEIPFNDRAKYGMCGHKRGHFKTYTADRPLFGKHVGTWWWSPLFDTSRHKEYRVEVDHKAAHKAMEEQS